MSRRKRERSAAADPGAAHAPRRVSLEELRVAPGGAVRAADLPSVAIVVLNYEGLRHLDGCFESLRALDYPAERLEVILVDNGSTDDSPAVLAKLLSGPVRSVRVEKNQGYGFGILSGLAAAQGRILGWTHADMQTDPADALRGLALFEGSSAP